MENIGIKKEEQTRNGWSFLVEIDDDIEYSVTLNKEYWEKLTHSTSLGQAHNQQTPAELIKRSFEFLLEREPKESILREFNLNVISKYFPEYEKEIKK